jgi:hypothetical protein
MMVPGNAVAESIKTPPSARTPVVALEHEPSRWHNHGKIFTNIQIDENRIFYKTLIFFPPEKCTMSAKLQSLPVLFACKTV